MAGWWLTGSLADGTPDRPRAVLVAVRADNGADDSGVCSELLLTELRRRADTDSVAVVAAIRQNRHRPDPSAYVATLAPAVRRLRLDDMVATLTDTIAFVRHLPHELVDAFRSTLTEVRSDPHLHVVDAAAPDALNPLATVHTVLDEIRARDVPELLLMNNTDMAPRDRSTASRRACPHALPVPPPTGAGFEERGRP